MASALSQRTGVHYSYLDVFNLVKRISDEEVLESIESHLSSIRSSGGTVNYKKKDGTNDVYILFIQTKSMNASQIHLKWILLFLRIRGISSFGFQFTSQKLPTNGKYSWFVVDRNGM